MMMMMGGGGDAGTKHNKNYLNIFIYLHITWLGIKNTADSVPYFSSYAALEGLRTSTILSNLIYVIGLSFAKIAQVSQIIY